MIKRVLLFSSLTFSILFSCATTPVVTKPVVTEPDYLKVTRQQAINFFTCLESKSDIKKEELDVIKLTNKNVKEEMNDAMWSPQNMNKELSIWFNQFKNYGCKYE